MRDLAVAMHDALRGTAFPFFNVTFYPNGYKFVTGYSSDKLRALLAAQLAWQTQYCQVARMDIDQCNGLHSAQVLYSCRGQHVTSHSGQSSFAQQHTRERTARKGSRSRTALCPTICGSNSAVQVLQHIETSTLAVSFALRIPKSVLAKRTCTALTSMHRPHGPSAAYI